MATDPADAFAAWCDGLVALAGQPGLEPERAELALGELRQRWNTLAELWELELGAVGRAWADTNLREFLARRRGLIDTPEEYADFARELLCVASVFEAEPARLAELLRPELVLLSEHLLQPGVVPVFRLLLLTIKRAAQATGDEDLRLWLRGVRDALPG
jgi:hypothetical protein